MGAASLNVSAERIVARAFDTSVLMSAQSRYDLLVRARETWPLERNLRWAPQQFAMDVAARGKK